MAVTLYLDVFFVINFVMDGLLLLAVRRLFRLPFRGAGIAAAAAVGGLWACAAVLVPVLPGPAELLLTWLVVGGAMTVLAFGRSRPREVFRRLVGFWLVSAVFGGLLEMAGDHIPAAWYLTGVRPVQQWNILPLCLFAAGIFFGIRGALALVQSRLECSRELCQVNLKYQGRELAMTALWDTGNHLYEPYTHQPVHVITARACRCLCDRITRVIYIPYQSVGAEHGLLPGIQVDRMEVLKDGKMVECYEKPWLAITRETLSPEDQYQMLLHR